MTLQDISADWYRLRAERYAQVAADLTQSIFVTQSHPKLTDELVVMERLMELAPGPQGLDLGCGAGARDVYRFSQAGLDVTGVDAIEENVAVAHRLHPELADKVWVHDLRRPLPFESERFDFAYCDSVIQHLEPDEVKGTLLAEAARVLKPGGVLQLIFKCGQGIATIVDREYDAERSFRLYDADEVRGWLEGLGMRLIEAGSPDELGGVLHCADHRLIDTCVMWTRKQ